MNLGISNISATGESRLELKYTQSDDNCNLLPSNSSVQFSHWENIPETLVINGAIGSILLIIFLILTHIAWRRSYNHEHYFNQGLISFLYGYREPEQWYVIPRLEFLSRRDRHHKHDQRDNRIYVPPKLPLANPIDILHDSSKERSKSSKTEKSLEFKRLAYLRTLAKSKSEIKNQNKAELNQELSNNSSKGSTLLSSSSSTDSQNTDAGQRNKTTVVTKKEAKRVKADDDSINRSSTDSLFYPSILTAEQTHASYLSRKLNRFFSLFFRVTDADIIYAKGIDAYEYLLFQRHLILIMFITNILCLGVLLPLHWFSGPTLISNETMILTSFQRTTIKNVRASSSFYWAHIVCSTAIIASTSIVLNSYRDSTVVKNDTQLAKKTLLIGNIAPKDRSRKELTRVLKEYFAGCTVDAIQFVYDTSELELYQMYLDVVMTAKEYCLYYKRKYNQEIMVKQTDVNLGQFCCGNCRLCSFLFICFCFWPCERKKPGSVFYAEQEEYYKLKLEKTLEKLIKEPSEYAFVSFRSYRQARRVLEKLTELKTQVLNNKQSEMDSDHETYVDELVTDKRANESVAKNAPSAVLSTSNVSSNDPLDYMNNPHIRSIRSPKRNIENRASPDWSNGHQHSGSTKKLKGPLAWSIRYAPLPDNVEYYDLLNVATISRYTVVLLHFLMIVIFIFFTTPNVIFSILERWFVMQPEVASEYTGYRGIFINYVSIMIQVLTTAMLPSLITLISKQIPYEDTSSKDHSMMWKVYLFLILMAIIMPSVGMSSAQAFIRSNINPKCLFPSDNGAYFVNTVISSTFLSTVFELIKPTDIMSYCFILWTSRSIADFEAGRQYIDREFSVGMQHTSVLLVFSTVMTYSISCPLIAPAGLVYLLVKHAVDHYNLFYTYFTKKVDKSLQNTIEIFVKVALMLMLLQTTLAVSINTGTGYFSIISQLIFVITLVVFFCNCFFDCTSRAVISNKIGRYHREFCACFYLPRVIENLLRLNVIPESCISRKV